MKDDLSEFTDTHRAQFEVEDTSIDSLWGSIEKRIDARRNHERRRYLFLIAASITLFLGIGGLFFLGSADSFNQKNLEAYLGEMGWNETEVFYQSQIDQRLVLLKNHYDDYEEIVYDLSELDSAFLELKGDLKDNANNEEVINAMIQNYRIKLEILERILSEIQVPEKAQSSEI